MTNNMTENDTATNNADNVEDFSTDDLRGNIYELLSACFTFPEEDFIDSWKQAFHYLEKETSERIPSLHPHLAQLKEKYLTFLQEYDFIDLQTEYSALFLGPFTVVAPPYSSVYFDQGQVMTQTTKGIEELYQRAGMQMQTYGQETADHIAVELEFLHQCSVQYSQTEDKEYLQLQYFFLRDHLIHWSTPFGERIQKGSENSFYTALADFLNIYLEHELHHLQDLLEFD